MRRNESLKRTAVAGLHTFLFLLSVSVKAQEEFVAPPAKYITTVPFIVLTGGIVILKATLDNNKDSLNFVLDTGSGGISLDSSLVRYLNLPTQMSDKTVRGIAGTKTVEFTYDHTLHLPGLDVEHLDFHINDYEILTSSYGIRIDGIMGYSFLRRYIVYVDYDKMQFDVYTPGSIKYPRGGYLLKPQFSTLPMQPVVVRDNKTVFDKFYLDTGAGLCMLLTDDLVEDSSLFLSKRKFYDVQAEGLGGKKQMKLSLVKEVRVGPYRFKKVPVYVFDDEYNITQYPQLGGLLGNDIMRRFNVILNYPDQQIYIKPNKHFSEAFDYSYTGMSMYIVDGVITITEVMKGSPAEEAGFLPGDIVLGIDNNLTGNIQSYKSMFQSAGSKLKVLISRNGELSIVSLKIKSIL